MSMNVRKIFIYAITEPIALTLMEVTIAHAWKEFLEMDFFVQVK